MGLFSRKNQNSAPVKGEEQPEKLQKAEQGKRLLDDDLLEAVSGGTEMRTAVSPTGPPF